MTLSTHLLFFLFAILSFSFYIPQVISPNKINSSCPESRDYVCLFVFNGALNGLSTRQRQYLKCDTARFPASQHICRSYCICDCKGIWEPQPVSSWCNLVWSGNQGRAGVLGTLSPRKLRQPELAIGTFVEPGQGHSWKPLMEIGALKWWKKKIH